MLSVRPLAKLLLPLLMAAGFVTTVCAETPMEAAVKATFVSRFPAFVEWPKGAAGPLTLCVLGDEAQAQRVARAVAAQSVGLRATKVRRATAADAPNNCQIIYAGGPGDDPARALETVRGRPVLTVTDADRGPVRGMIHFVVFEGRVRFHVDAAAAARSGLAINSKLLALALSVRR